MARRRVEYVTRTDLELDAIAILDNPPAAELVANVMELATLGVRQGAYVLRPAPARSQRLPAERDAADRDQVEKTLLEFAALIGVIEPTDDAPAAHGASLADPFAGAGVGCSRADGDSNLRRA